MFYVLFLIFLLGLIIGSFLNCLIWRLHKGETLLGRSYCPKCGKQIKWYDNIPVLSYVLLWGRCRDCKNKISWQYPAVEFITGVLFVLAFLINFEFQIFNFESIFNYEFLNSFKIQNSKLIIALLRDWFIISLMIVIFVIDFRWYLIFDSVTLPACAIVLIFNLILGFSWQNLAVSGIIGGSFFLVQFIISKGKWIGGGDIRLGLLIGLIFGWPMVLVAIFLAYIIGSIIGLGLIVGGKKSWSSKVPLGVFLSAATIITLFWGDILLNKYLSIIY